MSANTDPSQEKERAPVSDGEGQTREASYPGDGIAEGQVRSWDDLQLRGQVTTSKDRGTRGTAMLSEFRIHVFANLVGAEFI